MTIQEFFALSQQEQWDALNVWAQRKDENEQVGVTCDTYECPLASFFQEMDITQYCGVLPGLTHIDGVGDLRNSPLLTEIIADIDCLDEGGQGNISITASQFRSVLTKVRQFLLSFNQEEEYHHA